MKARVLGSVIDMLGVSRPPKNPPPPDGPSIVVLPLANESGDPEQEYLSDGVTEELTGALARSSRYLFVISAETAFSYRHAKPAVRELGQELGVRYVFRGAVDRRDDQVAIVAELVEAPTGRLLWTERYERDIVDIPTLQAEIVESIFVALGVELEASELARLDAKAPSSIGAVESLWRGYYHLRQLTRDDLMNARRLFERARELEPKLASPFGMLAGTYTQEHSQGWSFDPTLLDQARELAARGVEIDDRSGVSHAILGVVELVRGNWRQAIVHEERAIELEPNVTWPHALRGIALAQGGRPLEASKSIKRALRLDPHPPPGLLMALSYINYSAGRKEESMALVEQVRAGNRDSILARIALTAYHQREGDRHYARTLAQEILQINPDVTVDRAMSLIPGLDKITPKHEYVRYGDDLAAAGLPR